MLICKNNKLKYQNYSNNKIMNKNNEQNTLETYIKCFITNKIKNF